MSSQSSTSTQPQLATDFIKGMINRAGATGNTQKKPLGGLGGVSLLNSNQNAQSNNSGGLSGCLKIKNTAIQPPTGSGVQGQHSFVKDMKKHGIIKDIQDVNQLSQIILGGGNSSASQQNDSHYLDGKNGSSNAQ